jgi:hypothetical protein
MQRLARRKSMASVPAREIRGDAEAQITRVENHLAKHDYHSPTLESSLSTGEREAYLALVQEWEQMLVKAMAL